MTTLRGLVQHDMNDLSGNSGREVLEENHFQQLFSLWLSILIMVFRKSLNFIQNLSN